METGAKHELERQNVDHVTRSGIRRHTVFNRYLVAIRRILTTFSFQDAAQRGGTLPNGLIWVICKTGNDVMHSLSINITVVQHPISITLGFLNSA